MARREEVRPGRSVDDTQQKRRLPALEFREAAEMRRSDVVEDLTEIAVIGEVDYIEAEPDLARTEVKPARDAEVPGSWPAQRNSDAHLLWNTESPCARRRPGRKPKRAEDERSPNRPPCSAHPKGEHRKRWTA